MRETQAIEQDRIGRAGCANILQDPIIGRGKLDTVDIMRLVHDAEHDPRICLEFFRKPDAEFGEMSSGYFGSFADDDLVFRLPVEIQVPSHEVMNIDDDGGAGTRQKINLTLDCRKYRRIKIATESWLDPLLAEGKAEDTHALVQIIFHSLTGRPDPGVGIKAVIADEIDAATEPQFCRDSRCGYIQERTKKAKQCGKPHHQNSFSEIDLIAQNYRRHDDINDGLHGQRTGP